MPARSNSAAAKDSSANPGFEATGSRSSAFTKSEVTSRSLKGNRWFTEDKGNDSFAPVQHFIHTKFNSLTTVGDTLLPKLLSGDFTIKETRHARTPRCSRLPHRRLSR